MATHLIDRRFRRAGLIFITAAVGVLASAPSALAVPSTINVSNATVAEGNSGQVKLAFSISANCRDDSNGCEVGFATHDGSATSPTDYQGRSGALQLSYGQSSQDVAVAVIGDSDFEATESFGLDVWISDEVPNPASSATGTIVNDDAEPPPPTPPSSPTAQPPTDQSPGTNWTNGADRFKTFTSSTSPRTAGSRPYEFTTRGQMKLPDKYGPQACPLTNPLCNFDWGGGGAYDPCKGYHRGTVIVRIKHGGRTISQEEVPALYHEREGHPNGSGFSPIVNKCRFYSEVRLTAEDVPQAGSPLKVTTMFTGNHYFRVQHAEDHLVTAGVNPDNPSSACKDSKPRRQPDNGGNGQVGSGPGSSC